MSRFIFLTAAALAAATAGAHAAQIETVVVTASPIAGKPDRFATIVAKVDRDQILKSGGGNLADALATVPGVSGSGFAAGASRPVIRGFDANRVRVLEDGIGSFDVSDIGPDHGVPIDPLSAQSIEVVRGAATLRYGSQAIGGVVNAIDNRVPLTLPTETISGEFTGAYGTNAGLGQASASLDTKLDDFAVHGDAFWRHADDYDTPLGSQDNSFFRGDGFSLGSSYFFGNDSHTGAAIIHYDAKYGIPSDTTFIDMRQTKVLSRSSIDLDTGILQALNVDAGYANYSHEEKNPDGSVNSTFRDKEWDTRAEQVLGAIGPLANSAIGVQYQNREFSALGEDSSYLFPTLTESVAGFAFTEMPLGDRLHLQAGARVESVHVQGTPRSDLFTSLDFTPVSGAVGVLFEASDAIKLGLTVSSAARAPAQTELFARGAHDGPATFETGDPNLHLERANSVEGTLRVREDRFTFEGSVWASWFDNFIYGQLTGRTCDEDGNCAVGNAGAFKELNYTQQGAAFWGAEGKGSYRLMDNLYADVQGDTVRATLDGGGNVPRIPPYRIGGGLSWAGEMIDASFLLLYAGRQTAFGAFDTATPGYVELNANLAWRPLASNPGFELALVGTNLADTVQRNAASFNKDVVMLEGRDVHLVARLAF
jgi:iron complex outermembrane receptor protein